MAVGILNQLLLRDTSKINRVLKNNLNILLGVTFIKDISTRTESILPRRAQVFQAVEMQCCQIYLERHVLSYSSGSLYIGCVCTCSNNNPTRSVFNDLTSNNPGQFSLAINLGAFYLPLLLLTRFGLPPFTKYCNINVIT